jgi:hypothetical protein
MIESPLILNWITDNLIPVIAANALIFVLGLVLRKRILIFVKNTYNYVRNRTVMMSIKTVYTYPTPDTELPDELFTREICDEIIDCSPITLTEPDWQGDQATFRVENIPNKIKVMLEPKFDPTVHSPGSNQVTAESITGYKLIVSTEGDVRVGYQDLLPANNFQTFSTKVQEVIDAEYFSEETLDTEHIQVEFTEGIPSGIDNIEDEKLKIRGEVSNDNLNLTFRRPEKFEKGLRKYFTPFTG